MRRGMTLIELVMVMAIVGVLAAVVVPKFNAFYVIDLRAAVKTLASDIKYAQSQAISTRVHHGIVFDTAANTYTVYRGTSATAATDFFRAGEPMIRNLENVDLVTVNFDAASNIDFNSLGTPFNSSGAELLVAGWVILAQDGQQDTVRVLPLTGRVEF